ncbi:MAG TPA: aldehyde dehydrogenase family protein [Bacteroidales bacterium]|nr:aldehyde dehydrogenase family protein [Bacteroidales bacterium]HSA42978.1 aldehyde dehydrogenase family protein [Bacteroidales bacterium]
MEKYPVYIAGEFRDTGEYLEIRNAFSGEAFALASLGGEREYEEAVVWGKGLERQARDLPSYVKYEAMMQIAVQLQSERKDFATVLAMEACKPLKLALGEVDRASACFRIAAEESKRLPAEYLRIDWTPAGKDKEGLVKYFPLGLVAGISPFNFPLNLACHKIAPAIAAGCPIILKPSGSTPLSTLKLARLIDQTALPKGMVSVIPFNRVIGNRLVSDDRIRLLTFTGSPPVGWKMKRESGRKRVVLELGGNAGLIVTATADLSLAVSKAVGGAFAYAGQVCIHTQRIFIQESIFERFTQMFVEKTKELKQGDPMDPVTDISAMINEENALRVEAWIREAVADGAQVLTGGGRNGAFMEPTVITQTRPEMKVCKLEVFGPVVVLEPYHDFTEALDMVNEGSYGLQAGVFTNDISEMNLAFKELEVGGVMINEVPTFRVDHMPYGGVKHSGFGREGIKYSILDMMEPRLLVKNC